MLFEDLKSSLCLCRENKLNLNDKEDRRTGYSKSNRLLISFFAILIAVAFYGLQSEAGNYVLVDLGYSQPVAFKMYGVMLKLGLLLLSGSIAYPRGQGYDIIEKMNVVGIYSCIFGFLYGIHLAFEGQVQYHLPPHLSCIFEVAVLPIGYVVLVLFLKYPHNWWKFGIVMLVVVMMVIVSIVDSFEYNIGDSNFKNQSLTIGLICATVSAVLAVSMDLGIFYFRNLLFSYEHPLFDIILFLAIAQIPCMFILAILVKIFGESYAPPSSDATLWGFYMAYAIGASILWVLSTYTIYIVGPVHYRVFSLLRIPLVFFVDYLRSMKLHVVEIVGAAIVISCTVAYEIISWYENIEQDELMYGRSEAVGGPSPVEKEEEGEKEEVSSQESSAEGSLPQLGKQKVKLEVEQEEIAPPSTEPNSF